MTRKGQVRFGGGQLETQVKLGAGCLPYFVMGFARQAEAERFQTELAERLQKFGLQLHKDKTRLIEFGRYARQDRKLRGVGKPETFNFLGFTHSCSQTRNGQFVVLRETMRKRMIAKLKVLKGALAQRMHDPIPKVGRWLRAGLQGHYQYYGVPRNSKARAWFAHELTKLWYKALTHRSQKKKITWEQMQEISSRWLPKPRICQPYPSQRIRV